MTRRGWTGALVGALAVSVIAGIAIRVAVWPQPGLAGDLDQFVTWVHGIAVGGWTHAYDQNLSPSCSRRSAPSPTPRTRRSARS
jgi:hypothetical protein